LQQNRRDEVVVGACSMHGDQPLQMTGLQNDDIVHGTATALDAADLRSARHSDQCVALMPMLSGNHSMPVLLVLMEMIRLSSSQLLHNDYEGWNHYVYCM